MYIYMYVCVCYGKIVKPRTTPKTFRDLANYRK